MVQWRQLAYKASLVIWHTFGFELWSRNSNSVSVALDYTTKQKNENLTGFDRLSRAECYTREHRERE